jgi:hypothetical protein
MSIKFVTSSDDRPLISDFDPATGRPLVNIGPSAEVAVEVTESPKKGRKAAEATTVADPVETPADEAPSVPAA